MTNKEIVIDNETMYKGTKVKQFLSLQKKEFEKMIEEMLKEYHKRLKTNLPDLVSANVSGMIVGLEELLTKIKEIGE